MLIEGPNEGLARKKGVKINDSHNLSIVISGVSLNSTVRLNEARSIVKQCFNVKKRPSGSVTRNS